MSSRLIKLGLGALASVLVAIGTAVVSFNYDGLLHGDYWELKRLGGTVLLASGTAVFGFIKKFWTDVSQEDFLQLLEQVRPKAEAPTTTPLDE